jgi:hypothetical protein
MILILVKTVVKYGFLSAKIRFLSIKYEFQSSKYVDKFNIWWRNVNLASNQGKSIDQLFDLCFITGCMSSIGVGIQKLAIHSQLIGLKTALKISDIIKKDSDDEIEYEAE